MGPFDLTATLNLRQPLTGTTEAFVVAVRARIYADYPSGEAASAAMDAVAVEVMQTHERDPLHLPGDVAQGLLEEAQARRRRQTAAAINHSSLGGALGKAAPHVVAALDAVEVEADSDEPADIIRTSRVRWMSKEERIARTHRLRLRRNKARRASIPPLIADAFGFAGQAVLGTIAWYCRHFGTCKLSVRSLSIKACCSERAVQYTLSEAAKSGILTIKRRRWMTNVVSVASSAWRDWWNSPWLKDVANSPLPGTSPVANSSNSFLDPHQGAKPCGSYPDGKTAQSPVEAHEPSPAPEVAPIPETPPTAPPVALVADPDDLIEPEPKPVAPVTPTSIGHGPKTVRPKAKVDPSAHFDALDALVASIAARRGPTEDPDAAASEWEKPTPAAHDTHGRRWLAAQGAAEELTARRYPNIFEPDPRFRSRGFGHERVKSAVLDWLRQNVGSSEIAWSFRSLMFGPPDSTTTRMYVGFKRPQDSLAFRMTWGGGGPEPA